jgi:hypothetical protein
MLTALCWFQPRVLWPEVLLPGGGLEPDEPELAPVSRGHQEPGDRPAEDDAVCAECGDARGADDVSRGGDQSLG